MRDRIVVIGAGGHARSVIDTIIGCGLFDILGVLSDSEDDWDNYLDIPWIGSDAAARAIRESGCSYAALGVGFMGSPSCARENLVRYYQNLGFAFPALIDPASIVSCGARIGEGAFVGKGAIVNANSEIGKFAIINSGALVEHDCVIGEFSHIAVRACLCGCVNIESKVFIGANSTLLQKICVGAGSVIGAGALVIANVPDNVKVIGVYKG